MAIDIEAAKQHLSQDTIANYFHINSCVYEIIVTFDGESKHLMKQVNNPLLARDIKVLTTEFHGLTPAELLESLRKDNEETAVFFTYPVTNDTINTRYDYVTVTGVTLKGTKPDLSKPVVQPIGMSEEEHQKFLSKILLPTFKEVPFYLLMPITSEAMFDLSISHVPDTAVTFIGKDQKTPDELLNAPGPLMSADGKFSPGEDSAQPQNAPFDEDMGKEIFRQAMAWKTQHPNEPFVIDYEELAARTNKTVEECKEKLGNVVVRLEENETDRLVEAQKAQEEADKAAAETAQAIPAESVTEEVHDGQGKE